METIRILLVDDHQVVRDGVRHMLELEDDIKVVGEANGVEEALRQVEALSPDIVLMDIKMPGIDGIEATRKLKEKAPASNVIILTLYDEYLPQAIEAGAVGYLLKDIKREELIRAIRDVSQGRSPVDPSLTRTLFNSLSDLAKGKAEQHALLSKHEVDLLQIIATGATTREISAQLFMSEATVKRHVRQIFDKLDVHNRSEAIAEAYKRDLI
ncbi:response regulator [Chloroflexota bacterium]